MPNDAPNCNINNNNFLRVTHVNVNSLREHFDEINVLLIEKKIDVLSICETWLTPDLDDNIVQIPGYLMVRNDRGLESSKKRAYVQGGGVAFYIRIGINYKLLQRSHIKEIDETEYIILELSTENDERFLVSTVYRRPQGHVLGEFFIALLQFMPFYSNVIVLGDFNSNLLDPSNYYGTHLKTLIDEYSFFLIPSGASHHTNFSDTWLDLILVNNEDKLVNFEKSPVPFICGHDYIIADFQLRNPDPVKETRRYRDFRNFDPAIFIDKMKSINGLANSPNNWDLDTFRTSALQVLDELAPFIERPLRKRAAPWFNANLRAECKARDKLYRIARRLRSLTLLKTYRLIRKKLKIKIKLAREKFISDKLALITDHAKKWQFLSKLGITKPRKNSPLSSFDANELNKFYVSIATFHPLCTADELKEILTIPLNNSLPVFRFALFENFEVLQTATDYLGKAKGCSSDNLSLIYFKDVLGFVMNAMTDIYNCSLQNGIYPDDWKKSLIIPLNKVANPTSFSDTRPIANLPHFAKIFDKLVTIQLMDFLESNSLLTCYQSGFRKHLNTQSALLKVVEDIRSGIEKSLVTVLILFDFRKAFDSISHLVLLKRMRQMNFSDEVITWFHSYLSGRSQAVLDLKGQPTEFLALTSGIPQGSNPGPVAFLIFVNTIVQSLSHSRNSCMLFADDFQIYLQCKREDLQDCISRITQDANSVAEWANQNGIQLNAQKTTGIVFGSVQNLMRLDVDSLPPIILNGVRIPFVKSAKNLGVKIADDLSWNSHVSSICSRVHGVLNRLRFRTYYLSSSLKKQLVAALILPHFDYACSVYCDLTGYLDVKLARLFNTLVRFIFRLPRDTRLAPFITKLGWLTPDKRRKYFMCIITYQILTASKPSYLVPFFPPLSDDIRRSKRNETSAFCIPTTTTSTFTKGFSIQAMKLWDSLPCQIRLKPSVSSFKDALFDYLIS